MAESNKKVKLFGVYKSRLEVLFHGVIFFILGVCYEVFKMLNGYTMSDKGKIIMPEREFILPTLLLIISFYLLKLSVLGDKESRKKSNGFIFELLAIISFVRILILQIIISIIVFVFLI